MVKYRNLDCGIQSKDLEVNNKNNPNYNKNLLLDSNLGQITTSIQTHKIYHIFLSKLKSQNLAITFNHEVLANNLEALSFRAV